MPLVVGEDRWVTPTNPNPKSKPPKTNPSPSPTPEPNPTPSISPAPDNSAEIARLKGLAEQEKTNYNIANNSLHNTLYPKREKYANKETKLEGTINEINKKVSEGNMVLGFLKELKNHVKHIELDAQGLDDAVGSALADYSNGGFRYMGQAYADEELNQIFGNVANECNRVFTMKNQIESAEDNTESSLSRMQNQLSTANTELKQLKANISSNLSEITLAEKNRRTAKNKYYDYKNRLSNYGEWISDLIEEYTK